MIFHQKQMFVINKNNIKHKFKLKQQILIFEKDNLNPVKRHFQ